MNSIKEQKIFTENPEEEMWRTILQFSYPANIRRYIEEKGFNSDDKLIECISGSILQSYEYYNACKTSNLQISPLLLYYGTTNLLYGMTNLLTGKINEIRNHGMHIQLDDNYKYIAETSIMFFVRHLMFRLILQGMVNGLLKNYWDRLLKFMMIIIDVILLQNLMLYH